MCYKRKDKVFAQALAARIDGLEAVMEKMRQGGVKPENKYQISTCVACGCENVRVPGDIQECWFCGDAYLDRSPVGSTLSKRTENEISRR